MSDYCPNCECADCAVQRAKQVETDAHRFWRERCFPDLPPGYVPMQQSRRDPRGRPRGMIAWTEHVEIFQAYAARFGFGQTAERMAERGGFGFDEVSEILKRDWTPLTWRPRPPEA